MLDISVNKLGGLALILGPAIAVISFLFRPGGGLVGGTIDPADSVASIQGFLDNSGAATISFLLIPIGLMIMFFGFTTLKDHLRGQAGEAWRNIGWLFALTGILGWITASALVAGIISMDASAVANEGVYTAQAGVNGLATVLAGIGFTTFVLGILRSEQYNKIFTLVVLALQLVVVVTAVIAMVDITFVQTAAMIGGITYVGTTAWAVMIGLSLMKAE